MEPEPKLLTIAEAIALIASRDHREFDTLRSAKDRARKRVQYAIHINELMPDAQGNLMLDDFGFWARRKWRQKFDDLPTVSHFGDMIQPIDIIVGPGPVLPKTIEDCHKEIKALRKEIELLKPLAKKWRNFCEGNRHKRTKRGEEN